ADGRGATAPADPACDPSLARHLLDQAKPRAVLLLGSDLPLALMAAASERGLPVVLADARLEAAKITGDTGWSGRGWGLKALARQHLLKGLAAVLVTDAASLSCGRRLGLDPARLELTGPVTNIREPLQCNEPERRAMALLMEGRHAWFAASLPPEEEQIVLDAHEAVLRHSHRALLIIAPCSPDQVEALAARSRQMGFDVARRAAEEDPHPEVQVLVTDGLTEMGLWYRLAPVTMMGGTMSGQDRLARHPFEPAALGSAIVHGPHVAAHATEWQQLDRAGAARAVSGPAGLAQAMVELTSAEMIASLALNAWSVSTGGADVAIRIADRVFAALSDAVAGHPA
ncbi:MAG: glycosyltransferase N-terminal domain-containing protein, partial [Paracoccus sp. (in: a-proteobacteria)]|nr:glycosyltransferase N-terminal domain-containing protein [Paracoccus sp. (in: a-proteobacteria)]